MESLTGGNQDMKQQLARNLQGLKLKDLGVDNAFNLTQVRSRLIGDRFNVVLERTVRELKSQKCLDIGIK